MGIESTGPDHEIRAFAIDGIRIEQRAAGEDGDVLRLAGYAAVFNSPADIGGFDEVIRPGAFARAIDEGQDVALVFNHDPSTVMARTTNGTLRLREDDHGLWFEADLDPADVDAQRVVAKVRRGNVQQGSFSFQVRAQRWHNDNDRPRPLREILDVDLYDVSAVTYPAYAETEVYARGRVVAPPPPAGQQAAPALPGPQFRRRQRLVLHRRFIEIGG